MVAMAVTMLTAASAAPAYISLTALIMDWGGISRAGQRGVTRHDVRGHP